MAEFFERLINGTRIGPGIVVTIAGMAGVFLVLILFYLIIRLLTKLFPYNPEA